MFLLFYKFFEILEIRVAHYFSLLQVDLHIDFHQIHSKLIIFIIFVTEVRKSIYELGAKKTLVGWPGIFLTLPTGILQ